MDTNKASSPADQAVPPVEEPGDNPPPTDNQASNQSLTPPVEPIQESEKTQEETFQSSQPFPPIEEQKELNNPTQQQKPEETPKQDIPVEGLTPSANPTEQASNPQPPSSPPSNIPPNEPDHSMNQPEEKKPFNFWKNKKVTLPVLAVFLLIGITLSVFSLNKKLPEMFPENPYESPSPPASQLPGNCNNPTCGNYMDCNSYPDGWCTNKNQCEANPDWEWKGASCYCSVCGDGCCVRKNSNPEPVGVICGADSSGVWVKNNTGSPINNLQVDWFARYCATNPGCVCSGGENHDTINLAAGEKRTFGMTNPQYPENNCDWAWQTDITTADCHSTDHGCDDRPCDSPPPSSPPPSSPPPPQMPNCTSLTGPAEVMAGEQATFIGTFSGGGGTLTDVGLGIRVTGANCNNLTKWIHEPVLNSNDPYTHAFTWTPDVTGAYTVYGIAWNNGFAECRGDCVTVPPVFPCQGTCLLSTTVSSPNPDTMRCSNLEVDAETIQIGDEIIFTCTGQVSSGTLPNSYFDFRYSIDTAQWVTLDTQNQTGITEPFEITQAGDYVVQCRYCSELGNCTTWGSGGWIPIE